MSRNVQIRDNEGFRRPGDIGQGDRFESGYVESRAALADASYQGYGAYSTLDGSRVDSHEYAELDWTGVELEPDRPASRTGCAAAQAGLNWIVPLGHSITTGEPSRKRPI